ncbi:hypothetical protein HNQ93_001277 [Hymenobacter luteus]|uniref:Outer membrane protein beta-barrel domain-containing protein n=2 Tax=Hymenobacter TaxID=89966 RepID=A0A7W9WBK4_9BACT|nr:MULTISPECIES: hypothetical protein [Hymenobacter]MBB4601362.1 hypothetical protein [Hymenobacter latericoloratus]MBB6058431.1 hypothetical protein [Hymenobacter luteus]
MKYILTGILFFLMLEGNGQTSTGLIRVGISAGVNRQLLNTLNHADYGEGESLQGTGTVGFIGSIYGQKALGNRTSLYVAPTFSYNHFDAALIQTIPGYAEVRYGWLIKQYIYSAAVGATYRLLAHKDKQLYLKAGLINSLEYHNTRYTGVSFSFSSNRYNSIYTMMDYNTAPTPQWLSGAEAGLGLRLYDGVDLVVGYTHNFTSSRILTYTTELGSEQSAADVRDTMGRFQTRNSYISAQVTFWLNK